MAELMWVAWLPLDGCYKAVGRRLTWFIRPAQAQGCWVLTSLASSEAIIRPDDRGQFPSLQAAKEAAYNLENATEPKAWN